MHDLSTLVYKASKHDIDIEMLRQGPYLPKRSNYIKRHELLAQIQSGVHQYELDKEKDV